MVWNTIQFDIRGALASNQGVDFSGSGVACGYNHRRRHADRNRRLVAARRRRLRREPARRPAAVGMDDGVDSRHVEHRRGLERRKRVRRPGHVGQQSVLLRRSVEVVGMTKAEFFSWVGPPVAALPSNPNGIYYLDNDATQQNATGHWADKTGSGFLYADGDLDLHSNWRGVIYAEGNLKINGNAWILGAVINKGSAPIQFNGNATILYSRESLTEHVAKAGIGKFATLSWRE